MYPRASESVPGFSDSTVQHLVNRAAGVVQLPRPQPARGFAENCGIHPFVEAAVRQVVFTAEPIELTAATEWTDEFLDWAIPPSVAAQAVVAQPGVGLATGPTSR